MANSDKNLVITPNVGSAGDDPKIAFSGADSTLGAQTLHARIYPTSNGTLSIEGSTGQLFSVTNSLTGTIYSVNDISGIPSIEVFDSGTVRLAQFAGNVLIGNVTDNGVDKLQIEAGYTTTWGGANVAGPINVSGVITSTVATGTAPFTVASTTLVTNLNADSVDGKSFGAFTAAGGILYATSTTTAAATAAGTAGQVVLSGGAGAPTFQTVASANGASTIVARDVNGSFAANVITLTAADTATAATHYFVETASDGAIRPKTLANAQAEIVTEASIYARGITAGSATQSFVAYNGTTATAGRFDGGATTPTGTSRLNYGGYFYPTQINLAGTADTATAASHYFVETATDGAIRPKTLANAQAEIVTAATVYTRGVTAGTATQSFVQYNSTTATAGAFDGGATNPSGTTRLNYGGYLYATRYYTSNIYDLTGAAGTPTIYPDVTTGSITIGGGLTTGTLNLGAAGVGAKTVNIGTSTGTTIIYGTTVRLPNAGTAGAGKYLQSDASGNATWQTVVAGATITNDTTTNSDAYYPGLSTATTGAWTAAYTSSTKLYYNPSTGQLNATNFNSLSDATKKENVKTIESATEKTLALRGVTFDWIDTKMPSLGVIAQEVEQVIPDAVSTSSSGEKSVNYGSLVGLLIQTIKEQNARIEKLESLITR